MVEAKDYQGWISGEPEDEYWVQTLCGSQLTSYKNYFYNPLMKNSSCIRSLQKELPDMKWLPFFSMAVFGNQCELENAGLLTRVRQGLTKANRLFLQMPDGVQLSSPLMGKGCLSEVQKTAPLDGQKLPTSNTNTEYKEQSKTERVESTRRRYGEYQNVFLSGEEYSRLETAYPGKAAEYIERLSRYMASNDRHYANHYATIKKWLDEDSKGRRAKNYTYDDNEGECL